MVRGFSTLATYVVGDHVVQAGVLYRAIANNGPGAFAGANWSKMMTLADVSGAYLPLAGGTLTGDLLIAKVNPTLTLNKAASGQGSAVIGQNNGLPRWAAYLGDGSAESSGNAGSHFSIFRYTDAGTFIDSPFNINRVTGQINAVGSIVITGAAVSINPATGGAAVALNPTTAAQQALINLYQTSALKWQFGKQISDAFLLYDFASSTTVFTTNSNGTTFNFGRSVILNADPTTALGAATKQYVDAGDADPRDFSRRNLLRRNGGFEVWQRGAGGSASFAVAAGPPGAYTADGWYAFCQAGSAVTVAQVAGLVSGSQWAAKYQRNAGQTGVGSHTFNFPLDTDELYPMLGKFVRLSFVAKAGANYSAASGNVSVFLIVGTGSPVRSIIGFTGQTTPITVVQALTTTSTQFAFTSSVFIPVSTRQAEVSFLWTPVGTAGADDSFTIDDVQLEVVQDANQVASPFERLVFQEQLALCQRHFAKTHEYTTVPSSVAGAGGATQGSTIVAAASAKAVVANWRFPVPMRVAPTVTGWNPSAANNEVRNMSAGVDCSGTTVVGVTSSAVTFGSTGNAGGAVGDRWALHMSAEAGI
jgi:hypothetical protein